MDDQFDRTTAERTTTEAVRDAAQTISDGVSAAAANTAAALGQTSDSVIRVRAFIRQQPITSAFLFLAAGYLLGTRIR